VSDNLQSKEKLTALDDLQLLAGRNDPAAVDDLAGDLAPLLQVRD